jgi:hypothetical protein
MRHFKISLDQLISLDYLDDTGKRLLHKDRAASLTKLLEEDLCRQTSLTLGNGVDFTLEVEAVERQTPTRYSVKGTLVGPDSVGLYSEARWEETEADVSRAWWSELDIEHISNNYDKSKPFRVALPETPFPIKWIHCWESHLPDLYLCLELQNQNASSIQEKLERFLGTNYQEYFAVTVASEKIVDIHIAFSLDGKAFRPFLDMLIAHMVELHMTYAIASLQFGFS